MDTFPGEYPPGMHNPPGVLDGAVVLYWAESGVRPFFKMPDDDSFISIHGLAICQYLSGAIYRFSCDQSWEVQNDSAYEIRGSAFCPSRSHALPVTSLDGGDDSKIQRQAFNGGGK